MLFLFGVRSSILKNKYQLHDCTCPKCFQKNTLTIKTIARYFHLFFIPIFPTSKDNFVICSHCNTTLNFNQLSDDMKSSFDYQNKLVPSKTPVWHGCGCLLILLLIFLFMGGVIFTWLTTKDTPAEAKDIRATLLEGDLKKMVKNPTKETDSTSFYLKEFFDEIIQGELNKREIGYFSKVNGNKVLILLDIDDIKRIKKSDRYLILNFVKDGLEMHEGYENKDLYIGVDGMWNMVLVYTPRGSDMMGQFADKKRLYPFYDKPKNRMDSIKTKSDIIIQDKD